MKSQMPGLTCHEVHLTNGPSARERVVVILGSTGSIGKSSIYVIRRLRGYRVAALTANRDIDLLERQAHSLGAKVLAVRDPASASVLKKRMGRKAKVLAGIEGLCEAASLRSAGTVVSAMVGSAGLAPTMAAIRAGKRVALANKETLVVGGELIAREVKRSRARLLPVDSEHSAIFQCLAGNGRAAVRRIILTGSGGPFRMKRNLGRVTRKEALHHPTWRMGKKISIDSATLMNKGLEVIEAKWLFGLPPSRIDVMIHPQSIVHSMVEFRDGSTMAQMGVPDMRLPIQYALTYPGRASGLSRRLDLLEAGRLTFERPDLKRFPCLGYARDAARRGGSVPVALNAANEVAVQAFLDGRIAFGEIAMVIERTVRAHRRHRVESVEHVNEIDGEARYAARAAVRSRG